MSAGNVCTAEPVGWIFVCKIEGVESFLSETGDHRSLSPENWTRHPVYRLTPDPVLTVNVAEVTP